MKHIFSIHSNICVIVVYGRIKELIEKGEKVVVVSDRNTEFPYFKDLIEFHDIQSVTDKYRGNCKTAFSKFVNYAFTYLPHYKTSAKKIIHEEDFILYLSSCNYFTTSPYLWSKYCKGYYFIEEGTMSYMDIDILRKRYKKQLRHGQALLNIIGFKSKFDYYTDNRFLGCICVSEKAFPWCKERKFVDDLSEYKKQIGDNVKPLDYVIVTDYLRDDVEDIKAGFKMILDFVKERNIKATIGVKMHPTAVSYEKNKINVIRKFLLSDYPDSHFEFLPTGYAVEDLLIKSRSSLFSIFGISSLLLYSIVYGSRSYALFCKPKIEMKEIHSVNEILDIVHKSVKGL